MGKTSFQKKRWLGKIKAALDTRQDENLSIIARTDALAVYGMDEAIERAHAYAEAGADIIFVEAPTTIDQLQQITSFIKGNSTST